MQTQTMDFYAYLDEDFLEIRSRKTSLKFKIFRINFEKIPPYLMGQIKSAIEKNKREKVKKSDWDRLTGRNQYRQIILPLDKDEAKLLYELSK